MSGTLVATVYYALAVLSPTWFYMSTCTIDAIIAFSIGTSWTTVATIGVALMGVAAQIGPSPFVTAGAVISGACSGDRSSPLSDVANLAAAATGVPLYDHIRGAFLARVPSLALALVGFFPLGSPGDSGASYIRRSIAERHEVSAWAFLPVVLLVVLSVVRAPPYLAILGGALLGGVMAVMLQPRLVRQLADATHLPAWMGHLKGFGTRGRPASPRARAIRSSTTCSRPAAWTACYRRSG